MLLMVGKDIWGTVFHSVKRYAKANNKYIKDNDPRTELSYLMF